jgi:hypothetical protein
MCVCVCVCVCVFTCLSMVTTTVLFNRGIPTWCIQLSMYGIMEYSQHCSMLMLWVASRRLHEWNSVSDNGQLSRSHEDSVSRTITRGRRRGFSGKTNLKSPCWKLVIATQHLRSAITGQTKHAGSCRFGGHLQKNKSSHIGRRGLDFYASGGCRDWNLIWYLHIKVPGLAHCEPVIPPWLSKVSPLRL